MFTLTVRRGREKEQQGLAGYGHSSPVISHLLWLGHRVHEGSE